MSSHNRELFVKEFCAVAADGKCKCGNDYKINCKPAPPWNAADSFKWKIKGQPTRDQAYAPHHVLCVASIGTLLVQAADKNALGVVEATKWCANTEKNMIAMPLWGHTVKWYCNLITLTMNTAVSTPPLFANLPQHDWDHTGTGAYIQELEEVLIKLVKLVAMKAHEAKPVDLAAALDRLSDAFQAKLKARGLRSGGTHNAWQNGNTNPDWFLAFSMATDASACRKGYPKLQFNNKMMRKLQWLAKQIK